MLRYLLGLCALAISSAPVAGSWMEMEERKARTQGLTKPAEITKDPLCLCGWGKNKLYLISEIYGHKSSRTCRVSLVAWLLDQLTSNVIYLKTSQHQVLS